MNDGPTPTFCSVTGSTQGAKLEASTEGANAPSLLPSQHLTPTLHAPMPTPYELMDLYRTWWRASYSTTPNSHATFIAAAWAEHVLLAYQDSLNPPTGEETP